MDPAVKTIEFYMNRTPNLSSGAPFLATCACVYNQKKMIVPLSNRNFFCTKACFSCPSQTVSFSLVLQ